MNSALRLFLFSILCLAPSVLAGNHVHHHHKHHVPATKFFDFDISVVNVTRHCVNKALVAVNGQFPGPTIEVTEGDHVVVNVTNSANTNITIHWHGIRQELSCWQDGVGYITQCPIQPGDYFVYNFTVSGQRGTTFWHAHVNWARATVHGAFITKPVKGYPFPKPDAEIPVLLGEWWDGDVEAIEQAGLAAGGAFPLADALTLNGLPGPQYNCTTTEGITTFDVEYGKTYLLRIINTGLNTEFFFAIADHELTVVEVDSGYVKPVTFQKGIFIGPGQTTNVLVTANQRPATYLMAAKSASSLLITDFSGIPAPALPFILNDFPTIPSSGYFKYANCAPHLISSFPDLPATNDSDYVSLFQNSLRTLTPEKVPNSKDIKHLLFTVGTATQPCTLEKPCAPQQGPFRVVGAVNNITFHLPTTAILQAFYYNISGVYTPDFPSIPNPTFDYTNANSPDNVDQVSKIATKVTVLEYGTVVQLVLQADNNLLFENHPFHLHGFFFYVMGRGFGNYNETTDPLNFNYVDPPARFTIDVPRRGWVAIRFLANNPGAWLLHCHLDKHTSWGMETVFLVKNGVGPLQTLPSPPRLARC